jgi:probable HAF family extracellular repeat protein
VRLSTVLAVTLALGVVACGSEESPTAPSANPRAARATARTYSAVDLGTLGGTFSSAFGINPAGKVVGQADHAFLWEKGVMTDLGTLGGDLSSAFGINPAGEVVGRAETEFGSVHAFFWTKGVMTDLGTLPGGGFSLAFDINPAGQVVGLSQTESGEHATLWTRK